MTAYSGGIIELAPKAATFETTVTRPQTGTQGVYTITVGGTWVANETVTVNGTTATVASGSTSTTNVATAIKNAMSGDTVYTVTSTGAVVTLTEKSGYYGHGIPAYSTTSVAGTLTPATTTEGVSTDAVVNSPDTYVDKFGKLHASKKLKAGDSIKVYAESTYINPSGDTSTLSDEITIAVA